MITLGTKRLPCAGKKPYQIIYVKGNSPLKKGKISTSAELLEVSAA